jgi:hypothetical protein
MTTKDLMHPLQNKLTFLRLYLSSLGIEAEYASPNLVADITLDTFGWDLSSDEIVWLSDNV